METQPDRAPSPPLFVDAALGQLAEQRQAEALVAAGLDQHDHPTRHHRQLYQAGDRAAHVENARAVDGKRERGVQDPVGDQPGDEQVQALKRVETRVVIFRRIVLEALAGHHQDRHQPPKPRDVTQYRGGARLDVAEDLARGSRRTAGGPGGRPPSRSRRRLLGAALSAKAIQRAHLDPALCAIGHLYIVYDTFMRHVPLFALLFSLAAAAPLRAAKTLDIYFVDTEGGQATLIAAPSGQTLLIDTGYAGNSGRDADRIAAAAKAAGVKKIDYLLLTHHHPDHAGGVPSLLERLPVLNFLDHGPNVESANQYDPAYAQAYAKGSHQVIKPGDAIPVKGLDIKILAAGGKFIGGPGDANPHCAGLAPVEGESGENPHSAALLIQFGKFRFANLGDLMYNGELALECPENKLGKVDLYITTHHATHVPPKSVHGAAPKVIVMNNGARKGGSPDAWRLLRQSPGLADIWQLHFSVAGGKDANVPDAFIANIDERDLGQYIKVSASEDGSFTVFNQRNKYTKRY